MTTFAEAVARAEGELQRYSLALAVEFRQAAQATQPLLSPEQIETWSDQGLAIARNSFRSWEAAMEYFRASPAIAMHWGFPALMSWADCGHRLSGCSASIASSFFSSSSEALGLISPSELDDWAKLGRRLYKDNWKSGLLCGQFFAASPVFLRRLTLGAMDRLVDLLETLATVSCELAAECLGLAQTALAQVERDDVKQFVDLAVTFGGGNARIAKTYLNDGPRCLSLVGAAERPLFFALANETARSSCEEALRFFLEGPTYLSQMDRAMQGEILRLAGEIMNLSPGAAREFVKSCPTLLKRLTLQEVGEWVGIGIPILATSLEAGVAFFNLNSSRAGLALQTVARGVELAEVGDVLRMYARGLTGKSVNLQSCQDLVDKGIGWSSVESPTTEGSTIFLPPYLDMFETKAQNREAYKVLSTHQAAHLEFGTFDFSFHRPSLLFENLRQKVEEELPNRRQTITDFERFLDLFQDRRLARDVFTVLEDARVDARVGHEYRGIRRSCGRVQQRSLEGRPPVASLPLRQGILEYLIQISLDRTGPLAVPRLFAGRFAAAAAFLRLLRRPAATVEDAAEAALRVYIILRSLPNAFVGEDGLFDLGPTDLTEGVGFLSGAEFVSADRGASLGETDEPYVSPESVDYRGELKPELVQTIMKLRQDGRESGQLEGFPIPPELLKDLLSKSLDIEITDMALGEVEESAGLFVSNLMKEHGRITVSKSAKRKRAKRARKDNGEDYEEIVEDDGGTSFYYDEWDFRAGDYRPNWCRLRQKVMEEGAIDFFDSTLREHAGLANEVRRQFEMLRPEQFKKLKRLQDGNEFEIDHVVEHVVEKKSGWSPSDKVYSRKNKLERDIVLTVLLDMSASTDEEIKEPENSAIDWWDDNWLANRRAGPPWLPFPARERGKRIIDVEKESIVLLIRALETIGDRYGIYGFSGYGRDNVEFFVVKGLDEEFGDKTKRRIDKIAPIRGTRMGPAIRHCISQLEGVDARVRLLILLSDGRPQDHDYGKDRTEKEYAIHDTRMALLEAKRKNIVPFCLTVDKAGQDYMKTMMGDLGYEVVNDVESLPRRLPSLYRRLTT